MFARSSSSWSISGSPPWQPPETWPPDRQGQVPAREFDALGVELLTADAGLSRGLTGDPQGCADLPPRSPLGAGCVRHQIRGSIQRVAGVSQSREVLYGSLRSAPGGVEGGHGPADPPTRVGAGLGAHRRSVNRYCRPSRMLDNHQPETSVHTERNSANCCKHFDIESSPLGAPGPGRSLISSYISRRRCPYGPSPETTKKTNDPREAATSGGLITKVGSATWRL